MNAREEQSKPETKQTKLCGVQTNCEFVQVDPVGTLGTVRGPKNELRKTITRRRERRRQTTTYRVDEQNEE